jgi:hypothetical protein
MLSVVFEVRSLKSWTSPGPEMVAHFHQHQSIRQARQKGIRADAIDLLLFPVGS